MSLEARLLQHGGRLRQPLSGITGIHCLRSLFLSYLIFKLYIYVPLKEEQWKSIQE